eukprot:CFRG5507T1
MSKTNTNTEVWEEVEQGRFGDLSLEKIRQMQSAWAQERDFAKYHTPRNLMMAMTGEVGEVAEIFQWKGEVAHGCPEFNPRDREHLGEELADVLIYLTRLADVCDIDLAAATLRKIKLNSEKYPTSGGKTKLHEL